MKDDNIYKRLVYYNRTVKISNKSGQYSHLNSRAGSRHSNHNIVWELGPPPMNGSPA